MTTLSIIGSAIESYPLPICQKKGETLGATSDFTQWMMLACDRQKVNQDVRDITKISFV